MCNRFLDIVNIVKDRIGEDISVYDENFLEQIIGKRMLSSDVHTIIEYQEFLSNKDDEAFLLAKSLLITHTDFFRNALSFAHIEQWILPNLLEENSSNRELRIWSAGCSSGQEPYSIAMIIEHILTKKAKNNRYRIIATDISESALMQARSGEYREQEIQNIKVKYVNEFFVKTGESYRIGDRIKRNVSFHWYDLLDNRSSYPQESIFGNFDLVLCSNLLFYYNEEKKHQIVKKMINSLDERGFFITGEAEMYSVGTCNELYQVVPPAPIYKQRSSVQ